MGVEGEGAPPRDLDLEVQDEGEMEVMLDSDTLNTCRACWIKQIISDDSLFSLSLADRRATARTTNR